MTSEAKIKARIEEKLGGKIKSFTSLSGGCISDAYRITTEGNKQYFLKYNSSSANDMFIKEAHGVQRRLIEVNIDVNK